MVLIDPITCLAAAIYFDENNISAENNSEQIMNNLNELVNNRKQRFTDHKYLLNSDINYTKYIIILENNEKIKEKKADD